MAQCLKQWNKEVLYFLTPEERSEIIKERKELQKQRRHREVEKRIRKEQMKERRINLIAAGRIKDKKAKYRVKSEK